MKSNIPLIIILLFFAGCVQHSQSYQAPEVTPKTAHRYEITIVDTAGNPLEGVIINYDFKTHSISITDQSYITSSDGKMFKSFLVGGKYSKLSYHASKSGYSAYGSVSIEIENFKRSHPIVKETITINIAVEPIIFFNKDFAKTADPKLKNNILNFINAIGIKGLIAESVLKKYSINLVSFIDNNYLHFLFENKNVYNSIQLSKYDIGKQLFDNVVRKILNPLNDNIYESDYFYGYDVSIIGYTKNFLDKDAIPERIKYNFFIPQEIVRQYKNWEISNQQVLDASIILMDNDRIELKF